MQSSPYQENPQGHKSRTLSALCRDDIIDIEMVSNKWFMKMSTNAVKCSINLTRTADSHLLHCIVSENKYMK